MEKYLPYGAVLAVLIVVMLVHRFNEPERRRRRLIHIKVLHREKEKLVGVLMNKTVAAPDKRIFQDRIEDIDDEIWELGVLP